MVKGTHEKENSVVEEMSGYIYKKLFHSFCFVQFSFSLQTDLLIFVVVTAAVLCIGSTGLYYTYEFIEYADQNDFILLTFPLHLTHIL